MKLLILASLTAVFLSGLVLAQPLDLKLDGLAAKAQEKVELNLDGPALQEGKKMLGPEAAKLPSGVQSAFIRHYEFAVAGAYSDSDVDPIRKQVSSWSKVLTVKEKDESVEIFMQAPANGKPGAFLLIAAEPKELTVVQVIGALELAQMQELVNSVVAYDTSAAK